MQNTKRKRTPIDWKKIRPSKTVPDQSMSIDEIVKRFVRNLPIGVEKREGVYIDQSEADLEQMSRMDFGEKHAQAEQLKARNKETLTEQVTNEMTKEAREKRAKETRLREKRQSRERHSSTLDNTMPDDTTRKRGV